MKLHDYQKEARDFLLNRFEISSGGGLWLDPGLGKTIVSLQTFIHSRMLFGFETATVIAPPRVLATSWPEEIKDWGLDLKWTWITGDENEREKALHSGADIFFITADNLAKCVVDNVYVGEDFTVGYDVKQERYYLTTSEGEERIFSDLDQLIVEYPRCEGVTKKRFRKREQLPDFLLRKKFKTDVLFVDESTKFRNWTSSRMLSLKRLLPGFKKRVTLTGTPVPSNVGEDIFPQQFILDSGKTLGTAIGHFRERWERPCGYKNYDFEMVPGLQPILLDLLSPWYLRQEILDHLDMPDLVFNEIPVCLDGAAMKTYKQVEKEMYSELDTGDELIALSGGSKYNLCRQVASGTAYNASKQVSVVHDAKLEALIDLFEELNGKQLLVSYCFTPELAQIKKKWPKIDYIGDGSKASDTARITEGWRRGDIRIVAAQCQAMSHGVNGFQCANDICFYTMPDQNEIYEQFYKRIYRQGVKGQVRVHKLIAANTVEVKVNRVVKELGATQKDVLKYVKEKRNE